MRLAPVMLALLLALSPGAVAWTATAPAAHAPSPAGMTDIARPATDGNTSAVLTLGTDPAREAFDTPSVSLGSSLTDARGELQTSLGTAALDRRLEDAATTEEKKQILNRYRYRIENRIISLEARERQATAAFLDGSTTARQYARQLGRIDAEADEIRQTIDVMQSRASRIPQFRLQTEANTLRGKLITLEGPVRHHVAETLRGANDSTPVYVAATESGVVLSTVVDDTYVREITRLDNRDAGATGHLSLLEAQNTAIDQYPWVKQNNRGTSTDPFGSLNVFRTTITHPHGTLAVYLDGGTESIFKEVQHKRLAGEPSLPPGPGVTNTSAGTFGGENVTLAVNRTYAGGPLRVELTNETGAPIDGTVTVANDTVGRTGADGVLWTLGPAEQFRVSATHEGTTVNVTTTPVALSSED